MNDTEKMLFALDDFGKFAKKYSAEFVRGNDYENWNEFVRASHEWLMRYREKGRIYEFATKMVTACATYYEQLQIDERGGNV